MKKITIVGCTGSGKSTLARRLGAIKNIKHFDLDKIRFKDNNFTKRDSNDFMMDVKQIASNDRWVVEGIYHKYGIDKTLWDQADMVVWLDPPVWVVVYRVLKRSLKRIIFKQNKPSGFKVSWKSEFGKNGLLRVVHKIHRQTRQHYPKLLTELDSDTTVFRVRNKSDYKQLISQVRIAN